jgi:hypothetical protein
MRCVRCDVGYCPLTEGADLMIYEAEMTGLDHEAHAQDLALQSALAHPDTPMILVWHTAEEPAVVARILNAAPRSIAKLLQEAGARQVMEPESFLVQATEGPLVDGELEHARRWTRTILACLAPATVPVAG